MRFLSNNQINRIKSLINTTYVVDYLILFCLWILHVINNFFWLKSDTQTPGFDEGLYLTFSLRYHHLFTNPTPLFLHDFFQISPDRPPFHALTATPFYSIFGNAEDIAVMSILVFIAVLIFSVYGICNKLFSRYVGLLAAFIVSTTPILFCHSRTFLADLPLTAIVSLAIYFLLCSDNFSNKKYSILFGITVGLGMLTKFVFIFFILGPLLYVMYKSSIIKVRQLIRLLKHNVLSALITVFSGIVLGLFVWEIANHVLWPGDPRLNINVFTIIISSGILVCFTSWIFISITTAFYIHTPLQLVLKKDAYSYLAVLVLFPYLITSSTNPSSYWLYILLFIAGFIIIKIYFFKLGIRINVSEAKLPSESSSSIAKTWLNFALAIIGGLVVCVWWYLPTYRVIPSQLNAFLAQTGGAYAGCHENLLSFESISYYLFCIPNQQIYLYSYLLIVAIALILYNVRKKLIRAGYSYSIFQFKNLVNNFRQLIRADTKNVLVLVIIIIIPYIIFSASHTKAPRYVLPYIPCIAILIAYGLLLLKKRWKQVMVILIVLLIGCLHLSMFSWGIPSLPNQILTKEVGEYGVLFFGQRPLGPAHYPLSPVQKDWKIHEILVDIYNDFNTNGTPANRSHDKILIGTITTSRIHQWAFVPEGLRISNKIVIVSPGYYQSYAFYDNYEYIDYMVVLENISYSRSFFNEARTYFQDHREYFGKLKEYILPDGSIAVVYKRLYYPKPFPKDLDLGPWY